MIFNDAPRMTGLQMVSNGVVASVTSPTTNEHLGPGTYFTAHNENIRGGWIKRSFSNRQPFLSESAGRDKYTAGGVLVNGSIVHGGSFSNDTPGPGHYNIEGPTSVFSGIGAKLQPRSSPTNSTGGAHMRSGSTRMLLPSASLKDGVLFHGKNEDHSHIGPGYYHNPDQNSMIKKSFNARVAARRPKSRGISATQPLSPRSPRDAASSSAYRTSPQSQMHSQTSPSQYYANGYTPSGPDYGQQEGEDEEGEDFYVRDNTPIPSFISSPQHENQQSQSPSETQTKKATARKPGRMTMMESMVPAMFRKR